jgi:hypothetical protein
VELRDGWQQVTFRADGGTWNYGFNLLDLRMAYSAPAPTKRNPTRTLSIAVDRVVLD